VCTHSHEWERERELEKAIESESERMREREREKKRAGEAHTHAYTYTNSFVSGKIWAIARLGATSDVREVEKQRLNAVSLEEAQDKCTEAAGELAADTLRVAHQNQNRGQGVTKAQYVEATMAFMEKENAFVKIYDKWLHEAANIHFEDGLKQVCRLKQTCTPTGAARKYLNTVTNVCLLNYAVSLDETRDGTQKNIQGVWPCKLPTDSLPLQ